MGLTFWELTLAVMKMQSLSQIFFGVRTLYCTQALCLAGLGLNPASLTHHSLTLVMDLILLAFSFPICKSRIITLVSWDFREDGMRWGMLGLSELLAHIKPGIQWFDLPLRPESRCSEPGQEDWASIPARSRAFALHSLCSLWE